MKEYNSYFTIDERMTRDLHLKGNKLLIYALISKFSDKGQGSFHGSRSYIASLTGCTLKSVDNALKDLLNEGLIVKGVMRKDGKNEMFITYQSTYKNLELEQEIQFLRHYLLNTLIDVEIDVFFKHYRLVQTGSLITMYVEYEISKYLEEKIQRQMDFYNIQKKTNYQLVIIVDKEKCKEV